MNYLEITIGIIALLLTAIAGDFYRRLWAVNKVVKGLEEKMAVYDLAAGLVGSKMDNLSAMLDKHVRHEEDEQWPTIQKLAVDVAVLSDRMRRHMNGGSNEKS